jgi:hypothetical protein
MNWAHWHMILVHFPIAGCVIALLLLAGARIGRNMTVSKLANFFLILVAWSALPAAVTGGPSQEQLQPIGEEMQHFIDTHAMIALYAAWLLQAAAFLAFISLMYLYRRGGVPGWLLWTTLSVLLLATYAMAWAASLGSEIVHEEIRGHQILPAPDL